MTDDSRHNALNKHLEDLKYLYENAACGYITINRQLGIERINTTALAWMGYSNRSDIAQESAEELISPDDRDSFRHAIESVERSPGTQGQPASLHVHLVTRAGGTFPSLLHLSPASARPDAAANEADPADKVDLIDIAVFHLGHQETLLDVLTSTRARLVDAHEQAERADSRLEVIAQTTPDAIITIDAQQFVIFANPAAETMFQRKLSSLIGSPIDQLIPADSQAIHRSHVIQFGRDGQTRRKMAGHLLVEGQRADGSRFPVDASISRYLLGGSDHYTAILRDVSERVKTDQALEKARQQVQRYAARLRSVREDEQKRISRELHDDVGQRLAALKLDIYTYESELKKDSDKAAEKLLAIGRQTSDIISTVRVLATQLRPKVLDELGLVPALEIYLADLKKRHGIAYKLVFSDGLELTEKISTEIFRLVQEATHNIVKHARASLITVTVQDSEAGVHLAIRDNGKGIDQAEPRPDALGLIGMQERVTSLQGHLNIESSGGKGTLVECFIPHKSSSPSTE
ncbi:MAG: PAS domain S-box protein [Burkholderiaceae bacterium]